MNKNNQVLVPFVEIELDQPRKLCIDLNALIKMEEVTGQNALDGKLWQNPSAKIVRGLLWACLLKDDPDLKLEDVGEMLHIGNLTMVMEKIKEARILSTPKKEEGAASVSPPLQSTGTNSGQSGDMTSDSEKKNSGD